VLDEIEIVNARIHGYGSKNFARNLVACYRHLAEREISESDLRTVMDFAYAILQSPMQLIEGVEETIRELQSRHSLALFTKGDPEEQQLKVDRSGLKACFQHVAIVKEKDESAYRSLVSQCDFIATHTWMIGNSPKSDIKPALAAGLNAVFVPHKRTWGLELAELPEAHPRLRRVNQIRELTQLF
jgi:putative hydrolase of the HAD superfamily